MGGWFSWGHAISLMPLFFEATLFGLVLKGTQKETHTISVAQWIMPTFSNIFSERVPIPKVNRPKQDAFLFSHGNPLGVRDAGFVISTVGQDV